MTRLEEFNEMSLSQARPLLSSICASERWAARLLALRPFINEVELYKAAEREWFDLERSDWLEAFAGHPKIGDLSQIREKYSNTAHFAVEEQRAASVASEQTLAELAHANTEYERKFGYLFLICATGKTADEILAILRIRMHNEPQEEFKVAAAEQAKITHLRLTKWIAS